MITIETVCGFALQDRRVMDQLGEALTDDLVVANPLYRQIMEFAEGFAQERRKLPGPGDWNLWLSGIPERQRAGVSEALGRLTAKRDYEQEYDPEFFGEKVLDDLRAVASRTALSRLNSMGEADPEAFRTLSDRVEGIRATSLTEMADLRDLDIWVGSVGNEVLMPTGFRKLDDAIGGWGAELWMILADSGVGKSMLLQNFATLAAGRGKQVLTITLELNMRPLIHRHYRQMARADRGDFAEDRDRVKGRLQHWFQFSRGGNVRILEYPAYDLDPHTLMRIVDRVDRLHGVDLLILDYLDLMTLPEGMRSHGGYEDLGKITHMVRANCGEYNIPVLTATQAVRRQENKERLTLRDMGDSYNKVRGADGILGLNQTPEEEEVHQGRLNVLKAREGGKRTEVPLYIYRDMAYIAELDHPNTLKLMWDLGHLPTGGKAPAPMLPEGGASAG